MPSKQSILIRTALCASFWAAATPAVAQTSAVVAGASAAADTGIEDIVVTARKRAERLQDVPGTIIATQEQQIRDLRITDVQTLSQYVPSFTQAVAAPNPRFYLRGVGSGSNASFEQAVGSFADGIYRGRGLMARIPYFDLEGVDVQLGPQVVLYGNSTTGGAINVRSHRPVEQLEAAVDAAYEFEHRQTTLQGHFNLPLADIAQLRVAGYADDIDRGWLRTSRPLTGSSDVTYDPRVHDRAARVSLALQPTSGLDMLVRYEIADTENLGGTLQIVGSALNLPFVESEFDLDRESGTPSPPWPTSRKQDFVRLNIQTLSSEIDYELGGGTLTSVTGYSWYDYHADQDPDQTRLGIAQFDQVEDYKQLSQEFRFAAELSPAVDLLVGAYYQDSELERTVRTDVNFAALNLRIPAFSRTGYLVQDQSDRSVFADITWRATDRLTLEVGARYSHVRKTGSQGANPTDFATTNRNAAFLPFYRAFFAVPHDLTDLRLKESHLMPEAIVQYRPADGTMLYVKAAQGAKSGGFDDQYAGDVTTNTARRTGPNSVTYRSETATSFEAGLRSEAFDRRLQFGLTAFHIEVDDLQVGVFNGATNFVVGNADSRSRGGEAFFNFRATDALTFTGTVSYVDAIYTKFTGAACTVAQSLAASPCSQDLSGTRVPVPDWMFNLGVNHKAEIGRFTLSSQLRWNHRAPYNFSDTQDPLLDRGAVNLVDASISFGPTDGNWDLSVFAKNLLDERWSDVGGSTPLVRGTVFADTQRPFQIGVQARIRFGN